MYNASFPVNVIALVRVVLIIFSETWLILLIKVSNCHEFSHSSFIFGVEVHGTGMVGNFWPSSNSCFVSYFLHARAFRFRAALVD